MTSTTATWLSAFCLLTAPIAVVADASDAPTLNLAGFTTGADGNPSPLTLSAVMPVAMAIDDDDDDGGSNGDDDDDGGSNGGDDDDGGSNGGDDDDGGSNGGDDDDGGSNGGDDDDDGSNGGDDDDDGSNGGDDDDDGSNGGDDDDDGSNGGDDDDDGSNGGDDDDDGGSSDDDDCDDDDGGDCGDDPSTPYCFGDEGDCPCGNEDLFGGCANATGIGAIMSATGSSSVAADDMVINVNNVEPDAFGIFFTASLQNRDPFGDGLLCVRAPAHEKILRFQPVTTADASGNVSLGPGIVEYAGTFFPQPWGAINSGDTRNYQFWYRSSDGPCSTGFNTSNAIAVTYTP